MSDPSIIDGSRMVALEADVSEDLDEATAIYLLHPAYMVLVAVQAKLKAARDLLHDFNHGTPE